MTIPARFPLLIVADNEFPEEERPEVVLAASLALLIDKFAFSISAAVGLVDYCEAQQLKLPHTLGVLTEWREMAARDAAINVYHLCSALNHLRSLNAPSLRKRIDGNALKEAHNVTRGKFPDFVAIRDAVGHIADFAKNPGSLRKHAINGKFNFGKLKGRTFSITNEGEHRSFVIDDSLRKATRQIATLVMEAFLNAGVLHEPS